MSTMSRCQSSSMWSSRSSSSFRNQIKEVTFAEHRQVVYSSSEWAVDSNNFRSIHRDSDFIFDCRMVKLLRALLPILIQCRVLSFPCSEVCSVDCHNTKFRVHVVEAGVPYYLQRLQRRNLANPCPKRLSLSVTGTNLKARSKQACILWISPKEKMSDEEHPEASFT
jgi:hypothetical protein